MKIAVPNKYRVRAAFKSIVIHFFLAAVALTCLFPLFWMVRSSLMTNETVFVDRSLIPSQVHFENYVTAWVEGRFWQYFINSIIYTTSVVSGIVLVASWAAYAFSRLNFPGKKFFFYMFVLAMMIPLPGSFVPLTVLMTKLGFINSPFAWVRQIGYILCMINVGLSLSIILLKTFFDKIPVDLEDAARIDGCSKMGIWWHVALPLARPAVAVIVIFNSLIVWNEYILAMLLLNDTGEGTIMPLQRGIMVFAGIHNVDYPLLMAGLTIAAAPVIIIYLFMQKHIIKDWLQAQSKVEFPIIHKNRRRNVRFSFLKQRGVMIAVGFLLGGVFVFSSGFLRAEEEQSQNSDVKCPPPQEAGNVYPTESPTQTPSKEFVRMAWEASSQGDLRKIDSLVEECSRLYGEEAKRQEAQLTGLPPRGKEEDFAALNDMATVLFIRAEAFMNYGKSEEALRLFRKIIGEYKWAQAWDPRGWFWSIAEKSQASIDVMTGNFKEPHPEPTTPVVRIFPKLYAPGKKKVIDYRKYGEFSGVGTQEYRYEIRDSKGLAEATGEGVYPNSNMVFKDPAYKKAKDEKRLEGSHWDFVRTDDLEAAFYKWALAPEPPGVKLFYTALVFEKAGMYYEAIKAYHAIVIHFPKSVGWTYWKTPWYPAQAAIAKIKHIIRSHPNLNLTAQWMKIEITNGYDNNVNNDIVVTYPGIIKEKSWVDIAREKWFPDSSGVNLGKVKTRCGQGEVQLVQYGNGHWQMLVNGKPYVIKGMTYAPTKIGQSPDKGTLVSWMHEDTNKNGLPDGPFDSWVDKNFNNKQDADEPVVGDFQLMKELGVNTIREYYQPFKPNKELLRKMFELHGIRVVMGNFLGKYTLGSGATWFEGTDYENPTHQKNMMESVRQMVMDLKDEPYILLWLLGNENNYGVASNANKKPEAYFKFVNEVAKMIKSIDPNHPVAICNGDTLFLDIFARYAPDVDIFAANIYRGDYGFGSFWEQVFDATGKPAFVTEYGCPAYAKHLTLDEAEEAQAEYHRGNWGDIVGNLAGRKDSIGNALGGFVFEWTDEWWKNYEPFYHDRKSDAIGPFPGGYYFEEWFGITSQGNGTHSPFMRQLRKSYFAYKQMWQELK